VPSLWYFAPARGALLPLLRADPGCQGDPARRAGFLHQLWQAVAGFQQVLPVLWSSEKMKYVQPE